MTRLLLGFTAIAAFALPCAAEQTGSKSEMLIRLNLRPAPAPKPALRYQLLPELKEMNPGNPIQNYMKCMMEQKKFFFDQEDFQNREKLLTMPLKELPAQDLKEYGRFALSQADRAARLDNPDWQVLLKLKADGIELLLPEVQQIRSLARALQVRFRAEIAQCRFDDAIRTAKTMFAISRHLGEHPTLIGDLVGMAIASMTISNLEEMLEQPGCPNLYWALTNLPSPLISLDKGMDGERVMQAWVFRDLSDSAPLSQDQLKKFLAFADKLLEAADKKPDKPGIRAWLDARTKDAAMVSAARHRLVEYGLPEERLLGFSAEQVILLDEKRELEVRFDDDMKTVSFPFWQVEALNRTRPLATLTRSVSEALKTLPRLRFGLVCDVSLLTAGSIIAQIKLKKSPSLFADLLVPITQGARRAQGRVDQRIALLRHIEALRLHAAGQHGALPTKLSDVAVPLPVDPFTGKPFRYELIDNTAHLRGTPPPGQENIPVFNIHYEVAVQK